MILNASVLMFLTWRVLRQTFLLKEPSFILLQCNAAAPASALTCQQPHRFVVGLLAACSEHYIRLVTTNNTPKFTTVPPH
jgi:hypothetical protein